MPLYGQPAAHTFPTIHLITCVHRLKVFYRVYITVTIPFLFVFLEWLALITNPYVICFIRAGLGRGCGAVVGGFFVYYIGSAATFRAYGM